MLPLTPLARRTLARFADAVLALPFTPTITSGYRCLWHNARTAGAAWNSPHQLGAALDILAIDADAPAIRRALAGAGFVAITYNREKGYLHCESRP